MRSICPADKVNFLKIEDDIWIRIHKFFRKGINREEKAKVIIAAAWGTELESIPCRTSYFHQEEKDE